MIPSKIAILHCESPISLGGLIDDAEHPVVDNEGHSCAGQKVDIIAICEENYRFVRSYYDSMLVMQMTDPTFNAWLATVSLWISRRISLIGLQLMRVIISRQNSIQ